MRSTWVTANDYEGKMLSEGTGWSYADISRRVRGPVVTLGADDSEDWVGAEKKHIPSVKAFALVDPTGCGDAFRGASLYGLERDWPLARCAGLGSHLVALKIAQQSPQNYTLDGQEPDLKPGERTWAQKMPDASGIGLIAKPV